MYFAVLLSSKEKSFQHFKLSPVKKSSGRKVYIFSLCTCHQSFLPLGIVNDLTGPYCHVKAQMTFKLFFRSRSQSRQSAVNSRQPPILPTALCLLLTCRELPNLANRVHCLILHVNWGLTRHQCRVKAQMTFKLFFSVLFPKSAVGSKQSATPYFAYCPLPIANLSRTSQLGKQSSLFNPTRQLRYDSTLAQGPTVEVFCSLQPARGHLPGAFCSSVVRLETVFSVVSTLK